MSVKTRIERAEAAARKLRELNGPGIAECIVEGRSDPKPVGTPEEAQRLHDAEQGLRKIAPGSLRHRIAEARLRVGGVR